MKFFGCDVSKKTLDLAGHTLDQGHWVKPLKVANDRSGWQCLTRWVDQHGGDNRSEICIVLEATGVYHLPVAAFLSTAGYKVIVCNPGRSADYARSQNQLNKSDALDARSLQRYGSRLDKAHWFQPDRPEINELKSLLSLMAQLDKDVLRWQNRLEKLSFQHPGSTVGNSIKRQIRNLQREQDRTQQAIDALIQGHPELKRNQQLMCSIKGIGPKVSQSLLPLLQPGRFSSARQLAAFLGLTPCHKTSGTSLKTAGRLSGRGDRRIRAKLYMPAISAATYNPELKRFYNTLLARGKLPKQALTAVMRKLVHLCYGVVKNQSPYQENYASLT
jgi:transposase